ncbi:hypothetical protein, partial [Plasmodium yoelii yoelii]
NRESQFYQSRRKKLSSQV